MNADTATSAIIAAEETLDRLQQKRAGIVARVDEISRERASIGFAVHSEGDPKARKRLDALNAETVSVDGELQSLDAAIAEGQRRLEAAQQAEKMAETRKSAKQAPENYRWLVQNGPKLSEHAMALSMLLDEAKRRIDQNHSLGYGFPSSMQFISAKSRATSAMIMTMPLRNFEHSYLPPGQRFDYGHVLSGWGTTGIKHIDQQFASVGDGKEQQKQEAAHAPA